jgi:hypothetical protein
MWRLIFSFGLGLGLGVGQSTRLCFKAEYATLFISAV